MIKNNITSLSDDFLKRIYSSGSWSTLCFFSIVIILHFNGNFITYSGTFTAGQISFQCQLNNLTMENNICTWWDNSANKSLVCDKKILFYPNKNFVRTSIVSRFALVCDQNYLSGLIQSSVIFGMVIGGLIGPTAGDKFGRKSLTIGSMFLSGILGVSVSFSKSVTLFGIGKFFLGMLREISMTNGCILALEVIPSHKQSLFGMISQIIWSMSISFVGILAYFIRDWDMLQIIGSLPSLLSLFLIPIVSESPRWLISSGKFDELDNLIKRHIKRSNMKASMELSDILNNLRSNAENIEIQSLIKYSKRYYPCDILKSKYLTLWTGILTVTWIYGITATYSLNFITTMVAGNPYFTFCSSSILDGIAIIVSFVCLKFSRNLTVFSLQMTSCLCFLISGVLSEDIPYFTTILIVFGKMALNGSQFIISISGIYIYPSTLRIFGVSISCTIGKLAAISSPYFVELFKSGRWLPTTILGMFSMLVGILNVFYPDWINQPLSETIEDVENLKSSIGFLRQRKEHRIIITAEEEN